MAEHGKVKHLVKNGVSAEQVQAKGRSATDLRKMVRDMVETGIVRLHEQYKREYLTGPDVDMLQRYIKLVNDLEGKIPDQDETGKEQKLSSMSLEELAKAAKL